MDSGNGFYEKKEFPGLGRSQNDSYVGLQKVCLRWQQKINLD